MPPLGVRRKRCEEHRRMALFRSGWGAQKLWPQLGMYSKCFTEAMALTTPLPLHFDLGGVKYGAQSPEYARQMLDQSYMPTPLNSCFYFRPALTDVFHVHKH